MKRTPLKRKTPLKSKGMKANDQKATTPRKSPRSKGLKGNAPTAEQKRFHDALCKIVGCIACWKDGGFNPVVSVHHIDGRTKPDAHWLVLPLCAGHHQDGTGYPGLIAVHPWKARFEEKYGTQLELLAECRGMLAMHG